MTEFSQQDIRQIENHGLTVNEVMRQITDFVHGFPYAKIIAPARVGDGIICMDDAVREQYAAQYDEYTKKHDIVKFVPASGAATRMFRDLFEFMETREKNATTAKFLSNISQFAFYDDLRQYLPENANDYETVSCTLTDSGLNYGKLPKALIAFHKYENYSRTALEEHLSEGAQYAHASDRVRMHFTVSPEHRHGFESLLARVVGEYEAKYNVKYDITMSCQKSATDTIAVNPDNTIFITADGRLLFRPAGHGALIENLNDIDADIIFIKNIDNVCTERCRADTIEYKRALAGLLISVQSRAFQYIRELDSGETGNIAKIKEFIEKELFVRIRPHGDTMDEIRKILNRPIRVCGMVQNTGAPGGGPFWVQSDGGATLQIVESSQIAPDDRNIMNTSSHFNPVDLVCGVRDAYGKKFNLTEFIDPTTGFISEKSADGRPLRAMERPGLWNGAMAKWNTIFVQVPPTTFTPVKTITDLLTPAHGVDC